MPVITRSMQLMPCAAKETRAQLLKSIAVAAVSLSPASAYAKRVLSSIAECSQV
ncbi:hypothetical protein [Rhodococcus sp. KBS0724]|uniref:hypothetical protein n=1 Tax=Rhodococcus sp. KBS0724 TaxID=1179674 RepID=UPI001C8F654B|nr:hypothetical protein [Rhodococcus sp. KBS0724]